MSNETIVDHDIYSECPFCHGIFDAFIPWPDKFDVPQVKYEMWNKQTAICPICYSTDRERMYKLYMERQVGFLSTPKSVLHIAHENCLQDWLSNQPNIHYESDMVNSAEDMKLLDYPDQTFDVIVCSHVLEHVKDDVQAMKELYRVMKDQGWGIIQVPIALNLKKTFEDDRIVTPEERNRAYGQDDHLRIYTKKDFVKKLKSAGFTVKPVNFIETFGTGMIKFGFSPNDILYTVTKERDHDISLLKRLYHKIFGK